MVGRRDPAVSAILVPPGSLVEGATLALEVSEAHHLRVRRAGPSAPLLLLDGEGASAEGLLLAARGAPAVRVGRVERQAAPASLSLAVGIGDRDRFAWLVEKAAELGVTEIIPVEAERSAGVSSRPRDFSRLRLRAREALKQCRARWAPVLREPAPLAGLLAREGTRWLAAADGSRPPVHLAAGPVTVLVGPEGGFTPVELRLIRDAGWSPVCLGPHLLRFETAALVGAATAALARERGPDD